MSCQIGTVLLILALVMIAWVSVGVIRNYKLYCRCIALLEDRVKDSQSFSTDDGGLNQFERENLSKLISRDYLKYENTELSELGNKLRRMAIIGYGVAMFFIAISIYADKLLCK